MQDQMSYEKYPFRQSREITVMLRVMLCLLVEIQQRFRVTYSVDIRRL
jgi:hypothetical protein